jgi:hypothetical protein
VELPTWQVEVFDQWGRFIGRVDGNWIADAVVGQADGDGKHLMGRLQMASRVVGSKPYAWSREKVREDDLHGLGNEVVRWDSAQVRHEPHAVARGIATARSRCDLSHFTSRLRQGERWLDLCEHRFVVITTSGCPSGVAA